MTAPTPDGERPVLRTIAPALALTGTLSALVIVTAVDLAPPSVRTPLAWGASAAALVLCAAVASAVHAVRGERGARRRLETVTQDLGRLLQQQARATEESRQEQQRLIDELAEQRAELTASFDQELTRLETEAAQELDRLDRENTRLAAELERATRERAAAIAATSSAAGRMQALATATLADLRAMEDRHSDEEVLADLLQLDHRTAQAGRLADSIAVLTGARTGRRWARPIAMESILRGAMGRISGYRRVRVHSVSDQAVAGHAAEGVMHALAELLDNAANFSPPTAEVHVYVEEVPAGVIVSVEDSGLLMGDVQLRRAEQAVAGDSSELGGLTGTRLGLAVVGRLARKHGLRVSFRPSARGGTGVLMMIPQEILTGPHPVEPPASVASPATGRTRPAEPDAPAPAAEVPVPDPAPVHRAADDDGDDPADQADLSVILPKRRRGRTLAAAERARSTAGTGEPVRTSPAAAGPGRTPAVDDAKVRAARFSSFRRAVRAPAADHTVPDHAVPDVSDHTVPDHTASGDTAPPRTNPSHPQAHPEGDTTS
ncbi:ATP-binding protein [Streptomyces sp. NPDC004542]|uniref:sensor histidine kinase n=1 Tax=Streptomyces sp. NPDC004542 TaxID=3154281 RepID=UPI0033BBBEE2